MKQIKKPVVCFGMTLYNNAEFLPEAMDSLLQQSYEDFYIIAVDDCSTDDTEMIMRQYEKKDRRVRYFRNENWMGMIATWRAVFFKCSELYDPDYFAWASDHDRWDPNWLTFMVDMMDKHPETVMVYPKTVAINASGEELEQASNVPLDTANMSMADRAFNVCRRMGSAGNMIYGLFRKWALVKAGVFRPITFPDRLLMLEISAYGPIRHIPRKLWYRRYFSFQKTVEDTLENQLKKLFGPKPAPFYAQFPHLSHSISLFLNISLFPVNKDYSKFLEGVLLSVLCWEDKRDIGANEELRMAGLLFSTWFPAEMMTSEKKNEKVPFYLLQSFLQLNKNNGEFINHTFPISLELLTFSTLLYRYLSTGSLSDELTSLREKLLECQGEKYDIQKKYLFFQDKMNRIRQDKEKLKELAGKLHDKVYLTRSRLQESEKNFQDILGLYESERLTSLETIQRLEEKAKSDRCELLQLLENENYREGIKKLEENAESEKRELLMLLQNKKNEHEKEKKKIEEKAEVQRKEMLLLLEKEKSEHRKEIKKLEEKSEMDMRDMLLLLSQEKNDHGAEIKKLESKAETDLHRLQLMMENEKSAYLKTIHQLHEELETAMRNCSYWQQEANMGVGRQILKRTKKRIKKYIKKNSSSI